MSKVTLNNITGGYAAVDLLNENFDAIAEAFDNTLSRNGAVPNPMLADFDMNHKDILNGGEINAQLLVLNGRPVTPGTLNYNGVVKETQTATASQTVFDLTTITYSPSVNNLSVYVDGVYQNPSRYTETSATRVTFSEGLHVGAVVDFVVLSLNQIGGTTSAANVTIDDAGNYYSSVLVEGALQEAASFTQNGTGAVTRSVTSKLKDIVSVKDFGAAVNGTTDDTTAVNNAKAATATTKMPVLVPKATKHTASLVGTERIKTYYAEPVETDLIAQYAVNLFNNYPVKFEMYGDSTMYGSEVGNLGNQSAFNSPARFQLVLRGYFQNSAATVINKGLPSTEISQMLAGTDGSGKTFEQHMADSDAQIVYCNHCINSCQNNRSLVEYKQDLYEVVELIRKYGKAPVLCTPNPIIGFDIGDTSEAERLKDFVTVMRDVCKELGVTLVDNYMWAQKALNGGWYSAKDVVGDGVHPSNTWYALFGQNFAIPLLKPSGWLSAQNQFQYATDDACLASTSTGVTTNPASIAGFAKVTTNTGAQTLRVALVIEDCGLDLYIAHPVWGDGGTTVSLWWDTAESATGYGLQNGDFPAGFIHDYETRFVPSQFTQPGLHVFYMTTSTGALGLHYLRVRPTLDRPRITTSDVSANFRELWFENFQVYPTDSNQTYLLPEFPTSKLYDSEYEFTAQLKKESGVVFFGAKLGDISGNVTAGRGITVGLNSSGYLTVWEADSTNSVVYGNVDLSAASHRYYVRAENGRFGKIYVTVDDNLIATYTLTKPFWGGFLGVWANTANSSVTIDKFYYLNRLVNVNRTR